MNIATDLLLTGMFVRRTSKSEKINEERKKPLIYNSIISTGATAIFGSALDNAAKKCGTGLVEKFAKANANDPKLYKYIEGINIIRPTIIFALLYYAALPIISTWGAEKIDNLTNKRG